jgi:hypothetical protein
MYGYINFIYSYFSTDFSYFKARIKLFLFLVKCLRIFGIPKVLRENEKQKSTF